MCQTACVPCCNKKIKLLSELTEHSLADEIEPPKEVLRKEFQEKHPAELRSGPGTALSEGRAE